MSRPRKPVWTLEKLHRRFKEHAIRHGSVDWGWFRDRFAEAEKRERDKSKRKKSKD